MPRAHAVPRRGQLRSESTEYGGSSESSSGSEGERGNAARGQRPRLHSRKSSGTIIVPRDAATELIEEHYDENDARTMSPRRSSEEVDRLEEGARQALIEQAKALQQSLLQLVDRVESVKSEHEKLEGGNRFLQSYIGELMQTSKITSAGPPKGKGKGRMAK
ncbi:hypothetical protein EJ06DRAFT_474897 [Trichodelitschia bisporula]|uniref:BZIP transcription factor n=1 Tax=Trichodelitschia bisporula TaxID=703511 RepID=A0A6G1HZU7_9PEZI|nr:hypothetical protein EJ06DRAFT_474897 [Trichodelitschia bisporula]